MTLTCWWLTTIFPPLVRPIVSPDSCLYFRCDLGGIFIINSNSLVRDTTGKNSHEGMIKKIDTIINVNIVECYIPINSGDVCFYFENIRLTIIPHNTLIRRWAWYAKVDTLRHEINAA